ncbi:MULTISPECIES: dipeptidase [unclassified Chelatococcus]|uniref:dipeptidase n=1 Tax=unclassified Chelatococcus TaxID=2638111 RepID=UPI001BD06AF9|nr:MULTISPECIES: dipeptidase [unclassified Chelatococcus]MBS7698210.1 dipeptidase [Chelatococcus sp. YT9]MBX3559870.1 dipeptidase [Chelatococcus sp.]
MSKDLALERAQRLLETLPLVDGHNDLPWVIRIDRAARGDVAAYDLTRVHQNTDTDIPRMKAGRLSAQFWAAFLPTAVPHPARTTLEQIDLIRRMNALYPDVFLPATRASDILRAKKQGKIASFMTVESGVGLENSLAPLRIWQAAGVRLMTLCHNETLDWVDSATDAPRHGGLTAFGRAVVQELNRLGMIVDCAHVSVDVMHQVLDISHAPIVFSHSNARALCDHPRNVPDDVLDRLKANGGIVMATFVPDFINQASRDWTRPFKDAYGKNAENINVLAAMRARSREAGPQPRATLEQLADHIEYIADRIGPAHVGIGSDFFGGPTPQGLEDVSRFPHLLAEMIRRGWSDEAVAGLASGNFLRVFRTVERVGIRLRKTETPALGQTGDFPA